MAKRTPERAASAVTPDGSRRTGRGRGTPAHRSESEAAAVAPLLLAATVVLVATTIRTPSAANHEPVLVD